MGFFTLAILLTLLVAYATELKEQKECKDD